MSKKQTALFLFLLAIIAILVIALLQEKKNEQSIEPISGTASQKQNELQKKEDQKSIPAKKEEEKKAPINAEETAQKENKQETESVPLQEPADFEPIPLDEVKGHIPVARLSIGERILEPKNSNGLFQLVGLKPSQETRIKATFPHSFNHETIAIRASNGGLIDGEAGKIITLDDSRIIDFNFKVNAEGGFYSIIIAAGTQENTLRFWVEAPYLKSHPPFL